MNSKVRQLFRIIGLCLLITIAGCSNESEGGINPFDRLCTIYEEELTGVNVPGPATFQRLADRIDDEAPEIREHLGHLVNLPKEDFYPTLKALAELESGKSWDCPFIESYYN
jgi:hypothetical protein